MQLPLKYDGLLKDANGPLETKSTTVQEMDMKDVVDRDITNSMMDRFEGVWNWSSSDSLSDEILNNLIGDSGMFTKTFFDDIADELEVKDAYDSLFENTVGRHWSNTPFNPENVLINSHDCMWAGHCSSSQHGDDCDKAFAMFWAGFISPPLVPVPMPPKVRMQVAQQSLLKPNLRNAGIPVINLITPQTPPMSDDDQEQNKKKVMKVARFEEDVPDIEDEDQDLRDYFGSQLDTLDQEEEEDSEESSSSEESSEDDETNCAGPSTATTNVTSIRCNLRARENDHSYYHKEINTSMIMSDLGIETPSDSGGSTPPRCDSVKSFLEEEIDVVSISDKKYPVGTRMGYIPPTNPPNGVRRNVRRSTETAMTTGTRNNRNGVKIMLPTKRSSPTTNYPPAKRRATATVNENKGRSPRQTRATTNSNNGRRRSNDSEYSEYDHLPSEKRNLHNDMERQRRVDLRCAFEDLRKLVPEVMKKERAAKVVILREAAKYCEDLTRTSLEFQKIKVELKNQQEKRLYRLSILRRDLAMKTGVLPKRRI